MPMDTVEVGAKESALGIDRFNFAIVASVIVFCTAGGFINLASPPSVYISTLAIDGFYLLMFAGMGIAFFRTHAPAKIDPWMLCLLAVIVIYSSLSIQGTEPIGLRLRAVRNVALYATIAVFVTTSIRRRDHQQRLLQLALNLSTVIALFGIVQYLVGQSLPAILQSTREFDAFSYSGTDILRSNGLVGNTIVYGHFLCLPFAIALSKLLSRFAWPDIIRAAVIAVAILTTFSRSAITGAVIIVIAAAVTLYARRGASNLLILTAVGAALVALATTTILASETLYDSVSNSFIVRDLFLSENPSVGNSNQGHTVLIDVAMSSFAQNPWLGLGVGSQNIDSNLASSGTFVAVDGVAWAILVEGGLLLAVAYISLVATAVTAAVRELGHSREQDYLIIGFLTFSLFQFGLSVFINSGYAGKTPFIMYWIFFGLIMAARRTRLDELASHRGAPTRVPTQQVQGIK